MLKNIKPSQKVLLLVICCSILIPCVYIPSVKAGSYATEYAIIQVRTRDSGGSPMCTIQLYTQAQTYSPYPGLWRILSYQSGIFNQYHFQWVGFETKFVYQVLDIDWFEFEVPYLGIIVAGSTWRFKLYERSNSNNYFIFDLQAYVVAGGGTDVKFTPISSSSNGWNHYVEEINYNQLVEAFLGQWLEDNPA